MFLFWSASNPLIHVECKRTVNFCIFFYIYFFADFQLEMFCLLFLETSSSGARCVHGTRCLPYWRLFFSYAAFPQARVTLLPYWILLTLDLQLITPSNRAERFVLAEYQFTVYFAALFTFSAAFSSGTRYATTGLRTLAIISHNFFTALCSHSTGASVLFIFICWMK